MGGATHDWMDQSICNMARNQGIDTLIFQHTIGKGRAVTELLDTRADSYSYLYRVTGRNTLARPWYVPNAQYPTIWFPTTDGFVPKKPSHSKIQNSNKMHETLFDGGKIGYYLGMFVY